MGLITWSYLFQPTDREGGLRAVNLGVNKRLFDAFESPATTATIAAAWTGTNVTVTRETAAPLRGEGSMKVVVAGGTGTVYKAFDRAKFGYPFPGHKNIRIRYAKFKATADSGTQTIRVVFGTTADANHYRYWTFQVANDKYREFVVDLDPDNTESFPAPTTGSTTWDPELVDRVGFTNLTSGRTFYFDDIEFFYEYSLEDMIGFSTEAPIDLGDEGSLNARLNSIHADVRALEGQTQQYQKQGISSLELGQPGTWALELLSDFAPPTTTEIDPGVYSISRIDSAGAETSLVSSVAASESAGSIYASYTPNAPTCAVGDLLKVTFANGFVRTDSTPVEILTANADALQADIKVDNSYQFEVGWLIRIYDDIDSVGEWKTISSIPDPTTITVSVNLVGSYTTANNAKVVRAVRTDLSTAVFYTRIVRDVLAQIEEEAFVIADQDDFDVSDADADTERWNIGYVSGTEGGSADINTTAAGKLAVIVDPDATPTAAQYAVNTANPYLARFFTIVADAYYTWGTPQASALNGGIALSKGVAYDANNFLQIYKENTTGNGKRIGVDGVLNAVPVAAVYTGAVADDNIAFKIERFDNVWRFYYSLTSYPDFEWLLVTQIEDPSNFMTARTTPFFFSKSNGDIDAQSVETDFDNYRYYIRSSGLEQENVGNYDSNYISADVDGSIIEREEAIQAAMGIKATAAGQFEADGVPDLWDALVVDSSTQADITTLTGNRDAAVIQRLAALINSLQITDSGTVTGFEEDGTGGALWESIIAVKGTFTTSSATVPADTGRTEANDYFNGDLIVPISGAIVRQARLIVDFANAGGVFTLDPQLPFTAVPGLVDYVILHFQQPLTPAADASSNSTSAHVVGNKTDTIPAMNLAPGSDSIVAHAKAILERIGSTPADPDDSILTNIGQRDDTTTADDLSDVTTTSIQAKLRRLLLRFSSDAFAATIQGGARTDVETMLGQLATYFSSGGAAWSVTADPGGAARDNLEQTIEDLAAVIAGAGITTYPVRAVAADGISLAEVLRHASESIGENTNNNVFDSSNVIVNEDGSVLERLEAISQDLNRSEYFLADYDDFDVADADANTERWDVGYLNGAEGGSADIDTTTAGKLMVKVDPDATPTAAGYGAHLSQPIVSKYFSTIVDVNSTFGTPSGSWATVGIRISPTVYDINNVVYLQRQNSSVGVLNRLAAGAIFGGANQGEVYFTTSDSALAFKIERLDNVWRVYYSLTQFPDFVWVLLTQYEDAAEGMDSQQSIYLDAYSPGNADAETAQGDFDNFKLYLNANGLSQQIAGDYDSTAIVADRDGSTLERLEEIADDTDAIQLDIGDASAGTLGSIYSILGNPATALATRIGNPDAQTLTSLTAKLGNNSIAVGPQVDLQTGNEYAATYSLPNDTNENTAFDFDTQFAGLAGKRIKNISIFLDAVNLVQNATFRVKVKVNGATLRTVDSLAWTTADEDGLFFDLNSCNIDFAVTVQSAVAQGAAKDVPVRIVFEQMEQ